MNELIKFENVTLGYGRKVVLRNIDFAVQSGEFFGLVGTNGSGKTTLLRALLGILRPLHGRVLVRPAKKDTAAVSAHDWVDVTRKPGAMTFGYVPQRGFLDEIYPLSVFDVVMMGRYGAIGLLGRPGKKDRNLVQEALAQTGLAEHAQRRYAELSGGQKQRALIARALASQAQVLVLDEPTDGMDLKARGDILELVRRLQRQLNVTVVYVTHHLNEVGNAAHRLLLLHEGTAHLGTTEQMMTTAMLERVYGIPVRVELINGNRVVLA
ncbi:MAG: ABC transporter ATP-binding protein [Verrucomicrobiae bacterium]|nr:ABC transporter ATP-binding protein [Verrucomicrobiae bacterium]